MISVSEAGELRPTAGDVYGEVLSVEDAGKCRCQKRLERSPGNRVCKQLSMRLVDDSPLLMHLASLVVPLTHHHRTPRKSRTERPFRPLRSH